MLGDPGRLVYEVDFFSACSWVKFLQNLDRNTMLDSCGGDLSQQHLYSTVLLAHPTVVA